jgi:hypothetical protein
MVIPLIAAATETGQVCFVTSTIEAVEVEKNQVIVYSTTFPGGIAIKESYDSFGVRLLKALTETIVIEEFEEAHAELH